MDHLAEKECTVRCKSNSHAKQILNCAVVASSSQIRSYAAYLCHNFSTVTDELGRNLLHIAASCGKWDIVEWLLEYCNVDVDVKDSESGWTALHRSLFYGQLYPARILCLYGASLRAFDKEGFTPLDIILKDRLPYIEYLPSNPSEVYAWGSNVNCNLGLGKVQSRDVPELLEVFRKDFISIKQVDICKFHSAFLSTNGKVYTCGYGHGGRLGQGNEDTCLVPSLVKGIGSQQCLQVAAGQDHLLFLLEGGQVWSCGLNTYHQLGHIPPPERLLIPKAISLKFLKGKEIVGVRAARFHSVIYTKSCVYTFGLNAGQLGHPKGDRTQINPRLVSTLFNEDLYITHVEVSDGATVCATSRGDIYVLHEYQIRKIASRQLEILKLSVVGGHLDSRCDVAGVREGGGLELRVVLLTKSGKVYLWKQTDPYFRRCLFTLHKLQKEFIVSDVHINHYSLAIITKENEGYLGTIAPFKGKRTAPPSTTLHAPTIHSSHTSGLTYLLDTDDCCFVRVKKLPLIYRGTSITSDSKGRNFSVIQSSPKMGLVEVPMISESQMLKQFARFYSDTCIGDEFHDVVIEVGKRKFAAHKFILSSRSEFFQKQFCSGKLKKDVLVLDNMKAEAFEQILKYIYCNHSDFLTPNYEFKWEKMQENGKKKKGAKVSKELSPVILLQEASKKLGINALAKRLDSVRLINGKIAVLETSPAPKFFFNRHSLLNLADVNLIAANGDIFPCHKCILVARLDYFQSMLSTSWAESSYLGNLSLPISSEVMEVVLEYIYSDKASKILASEDPEFICHVLMISDQLLINRLKELSEMALVELITLKNATELLELASVYNATQLKQSCMQFISLNLAAIIEARALEFLSDQVMMDLSAYYRNSLPAMFRRRISCSGGPTRDELSFIEEHFPVNSTCPFEKYKMEDHGNRPKGRHRTISRSEKEATSPRNKNNSESSDKDIIFDVIAPSMEELKIVESATKPLDLPLHSPKKVEDSCKKPAQWIMSCPTPDELKTLDKIMCEEKLKLSTLNRKSDMKPIPHLSQKQKKMLDNAKDRNIDLIPNSPPNKTSCPWGKLQEQSPPSPSFWDALAKKEFQPSFISSDVTPTKGSSSSSDSQLVVENGSPSLDKTQGIVISLTDIQKDEEQKQRSLVNSKTKPLHLINIEDQAIEELIALYKAEDNPKEKITVSRVMQEIASPVWKKRGK
ncbi:inhibitor of Bruton tyrosine kinase-like isoform X2 [Uloborus diversus]|uniref:inhibitor of Bruton tyrosine kinase-like isoform X2 n=1 Tax=Uloborus diversus TaxID=327109 RepID=UPI00240902F7|nr:inhibitor of Bruton tyrosine kinase-like isoform X2 [Uloborus diversus]